MFVLNNKWCLRAWALLLFVLISFFSLSAREINVRGTVTDDEDGSPLWEVVIYKVLPDGMTQEAIDYTGEDGRFMIRVESDAVLRFVVMTHEEVQVPVNDQMEIDVKMHRASKVLDEVVVTAKGGKIVTPAFPKTDIVVRGNFLIIDGNVGVPNSIFLTNCRAVIQPILHNVTRGSIAFMHPKVYDGREYNATQERMYDFDLTQDPLSEYIEVKQTGSAEKYDYVHYYDSVYVDNPNEEFFCDLALCMENYNSIIYQDTAEVAKGTVNPLRHLEFSFPGAPITDERYLPDPDMQLRGASGDVNLTFEVGKAALNLEAGNNRAELENMKRLLKEIEENPNAKFNGIVISGTSSPEGGYTKNEDLAKRRMAWAMDFVMKDASAMIRNAKGNKTQASVEKWDRVAEMLRADSLLTEADAVQAIINRNPKNHDAQSRGIVSLPFYRKLIVPTYLPRLRRVSYELSYMIFRPLSDEEVDELYREGKYSEIPQHDFWKLYNRADSLPEREAICKKAMETYPGIFLAATNDWVAMSVDKKQGDTEVLLPYLKRYGSKIPPEVRYNHVASLLLKGGDFNQADSLARLLPDEGVFRNAKIYARALNGDFDSVKDEIAQSSPINDVVMLLAVNRDEIAWERAKKLGDSAKEDYLRAVAVYRVWKKDDMRFDLDGLPEQYLTSAMKKDPSLRDLARVDGDLVELLKKIEGKEKDARENGE